MSGTTQIAGPYYDEAGRRHNVDPVLLRAIAHVESGENDNIPNSKAGAIGRMQFMPATAAEYGVRNPRDPAQAVPGAAAKINDLLNAYGGDVPKALMAYNGGHPSRWNNPETQAYPGKVLAAYQRLMSAPVAKDDFSDLLKLPGAEPEAPPHDISDLLGVGQAQPAQTDAPQSSASGVGNSVLRGVHQAIDVPATALASGADWVAKQFGGNTNFAADAAAAPQQFNAAYDADPNNQGFLPGAARLAGNALMTIPAAVGVGGPVAAATRLAAGAGPVASVLGSAASGAAQGATVAGMQGEDVGQGAALGGALGGALGTVGAGVNKLLQPADRAAVETATGKYGLPLRAGQTSASPTIRSLDERISRLPFSGMESSNANIRDGFTRAVARTFGEDTTAITPKTMFDAKTRIGGVMNDIANRTKIEADKPLLTDLQTIAESAKKMPSIFNDVRPHITDILETAAANGGVIPGKAYQTLVGKGSALDVAQHANDSSVRHYANQIREALDEAFQRSAQPGDAKKLAEARYQYKNMMTIAPLVVKGVPGEINPQLVQGVANRSFKSAPFKGAGDLGELGDIAKQFMREGPNSGSPGGIAFNTAMLGGPSNVTATGAAWNALRGAAGLAANRTIGSALRSNPLTGVEGVPGTVPAALLLRNRLLLNQEGQGQ